MSGSPHPKQPYEYNHDLATAYVGLRLHLHSLVDIRVLSVSFPLLSFFCPSSLASRAKQRLTVAAC